MRVSRRTKNRGEHDLVPTGRTSASVFGFEGTECELFWCTDDGCEWVGWLPHAELVNRRGEGDRHY